MDPSGSILYCDFYVKTGRVTLFFLWLRDLDSNQDKQIQSLLSYH